MKNPQTSKLIGSGYAVGLNTLEGLLFEPDKPYRCCLICGEVYQTTLDRNPDNANDVALAGIQRQVWADNHAKKHTEREHLMLKLSGHSMTPEASHRLAAFGVIPVSDMILSEEHEDALLKSSPIPKDDAEGR